MQTKWVSRTANFAFVLSFIAYANYKLCNSQYSHGIPLCLYLWAMCTKNQWYKNNVDGCVCHLFVWRRTHNNNADESPHCSETNKYFKQFWNAIDGILTPVSFALSSSPFLSFPFHFSLCYFVSINIHECDLIRAAADSVLFKTVHRNSSVLKRTVFTWSTWINELAKYQKVFYSRLKRFEINARIFPFGNRSK